MSQQLIDVGAGADDGTGDPGRTAFIKVNENFTDLYTTRAQVQYTAITIASTLINDADLILGHNIFGVNYPGEVSIALPANTDSNKLVVIKDESGIASTNNINITVKTLLPPTDFSIDSVTSTTANISWTPPVRGDIIGYLIYVNGIPTVNTPYEIGSSFVVPGLTSGIFYTMYMASYDADFISASSNEDTAKTS